MKKLNSKGSVAIVLCLFTVVLFGITAYVVDIGLAYVEKAKLINAVDSAALSAIMELPYGDTKTIETADEYLTDNGVDPNKADIAISYDRKAVQINTAKNIKHLFAPILGIKSSNINAKTKAVIAPLKSLNGGLRPFAVEKFDYTYGSLVTLKENAGDSYKGNYGAVDLGGTGADVFKNNALYGYKGKISVGEYINTETGDMAGAANAIKKYINSEASSFDNYPRNSIRLWTIPLVDTLQVNGKGEIQVVGFGEFYVEDVNLKSGKIEINGRFIRYVRSGEVDESLEDTGLYGRKLVE